MAIDIGDVRRVTGTFKNSSSVDTDPTTITLEFTDPAGTTTTYVFGVDVELVKSATGIYYADISLDSSGTWIYRFSGTGTVEAAEEGTFIVVSKRTP